jgi:hypothetical protein
MGGIKDKKDQHPGSASILLFFRWFLLHNLIKTNLINSYDRFIITRSDYIYRLPHPNLDLLDKTNIWIPDGESYDGYTDRHVILSPSNIESYLNILNNMILKSNEYFYKMKNNSDWNLERLIKFNLTQNNVVHLVKPIPYIMYTVRAINGTTRWAAGTYNKDLGYCIKYNTEYELSAKHEDEFKKSNLPINEFYNNYLNNLN